MPADDHTNAVDSTAAAGVRGPSSGLAHGKCAYSGVFTSTQYGPEAGRLHGADEPDDVQLTLAGQFALRPSMFQEVGIGEGPVVSWGYTESRAVQREETGDRVGWIPDRHGRR